MALTEIESALATLFLEACTGSSDDVAAALQRARLAGAPAAFIDETLLLVQPYGGVPRAILAFTAWRAIVPKASTEVDPPADRLASAASAFGFVYAEKAERIRKELATLHPALEAAIYEDSYGRMLARAHLPWRVKELAALPVLAAMGAGRQTAAHALSARRAGATDDEIVEAIQLAARRIGQPGLDTIVAGTRAILERR